LDICLGHLVQIARSRTGTNRGLRIRMAQGKNDLPKRRQSPDPAITTTRRGAGRIASVTRADGSIYDYIRFPKNRVFPRLGD